MRQNHTLEKLKRMLVAGQSYRRADFVPLSSNVDRHLAKLVIDGLLKKLSSGIYVAPRTTNFGEAPPEENSLIRTFLKDHSFVVYTPSQFNSLELGTTQLYNQRIVFNRKRVGNFTLGGRSYTFHRWREAPKKVTLEFLVVELINRLSGLAENRDQVIDRLKKKIPTLNSRRLKHAATHYGTLSTQKKISDLMASNKELRIL